MIWSFVFCATGGAVLALMIAWYARHRDERDERETPKESRLKTPEEKARAEEEARLRKQFDNLMKYTGESQKR